MDTHADFAITTKSPFLISVFRKLRINIQILVLRKSFEKETYLLPDFYAIYSAAP
jgi:hypothetical protein